MSALVCWNCGASLDEVPRPISRHAQCGNCFTDLHCCRLCRHFDPERATTCHEDRADTPLQKENANFCEFFRPRPGAFERRTAQRSDAARGNLEALFGDASNAPATDEDAAPAEPGKDDPTRRKLDDLFKS